MRWMNLDDEESDEYGTHATVLDWAQERPILAVVAVLLVWLTFIIALNTVYGLFLSLGWGCPGPQRPGHSGDGSAPFGGRSTPRAGDYLLGRCRLRKGSEDHAWNRQVC